MKSSIKYFLPACVFILFTNRSGAQVALAKPQNILRPVSPNTTIVNLSGSIGDISPVHSWSVSPLTGVTIQHPDPADPAATATFTSAATGVYTFTLTRGASSATTTVTVGNLVAASNGGQDISLFNVVNGSMASGNGPAYMFDPFPDATTTAALGVTMNGFYYYMPNVFNNGSVTLYAASLDGLTVVPVATTDLNGNSNNNLGFVRLAIDATGKGWLLAGDGVTVYLASFVANGLNSTTIDLVDDNVTVIGSSASVFQNGDLCFSGSGTLFALANNGSGVTQIFTGTPNGTNTILTKKWDLVDGNGNNFNGNVNGVAFDILGSMYISAGGTSGGLYYINQNTVNTGTGTVQFSLVWSGAGLTDLASNYFPAQTSLPVRLVNFTGHYRNKQAILNWETENEQGFSHFEIERSNNGSSYSAVAIKYAAGNASSKQSYQFTDDLSALTGTAFTYRLKMVDADGKFKYSPVIMIRRESNSINGIAISPNPVVNGSATVRFTAAVTGNITLSVIDLSGKTVLQQQHKVFEGNNSIALNRTKGLAKGVYVLQVISEGKVQAVKVVIANL
ncbi:MAG: T9SS type A sorting domain-containing protein [Chitinophagaceae bacterium]|nr:T9SS type A sorting domain-containing protein [Chitinophagaceae bacterium]